jgi:hypothetical protein
MRPRIFKSRIFDHWVLQFYDKGVRRQHTGTWRWCMDVLRAYLTAKPVGRIGGAA